MKKIIYSAIFAVFSFIVIACDNDPITITHGIPVKVDPSGVISSFTYELKTGELESFDTGNKLRVRLLAYNSEGKLAASDSAFLTNYAAILNSSIQLTEGTYTLIAITDIVKRESNRTTLEYWILSNVSDINQVKVSNAGYIGGKNKILGIANQSITVTGSQMSTINMNPKPSGALLCIRYLNIHQFSDVTKYELQTNRNCDYLTFDSNGKYVSVPENKNNQFNWRVSYINPKDSQYASYQYIYGWNFMFPVSNANYRFVYSTDTETENVLVTDMIVNFNAGDEYLFMLDLADEDYNYGITYYYGKVNGSSRRASTTDIPLTPWMEKKLADIQHTAKLKDLMK